MFILYSTNKFFYENALIGYSFCFFIVLLASLIELFALWAEHRSALVATLRNFYTRLFYYLQLYKENFMKISLFMGLRHFSCFARRSEDRCRLFKAP